MVRDASPSVLPHAPHQWPWAQPPAPGSSDSAPSYSPATLAEPPPSAPPATPDRRCLYPAYGSPTAAPPPAQPPPQLPPAHAAASPGYRRVSAAPACRHAVLYCLVERWRSALPATASPLVSPLQQAPDPGAPSAGRYPALP